MKVSVLCLPGVMLFTLAYLLTGNQPLALLGHVCLLGYVLAEWPRLSPLARSMILCSLGALVVLPPLSAAPFQTLFEAMNRAAWFATFFGAMSYLREAAASSPMVLRCGETIISQSPAKRYATLSGGVFLIGVLLNMGVLHLLGIMVRQANTLEASGGSSSIQAVRTRRMFSALTRGFATTPLGSPLTMTLALILSLVPGVEWQTVLPLGVVAMVLLHLLGWGWDRWTAPRHLGAGVGMKPPPGGSWRPIAGFSGLVLAIFLAAVAVELAFALSLPLAILLVAPMAGLLWLVVQNGRLGVLPAIRVSTARFRHGAGQQFGAIRTEIIMMGSAGLQGTLLAKVIPTSVFVDVLNTMGLHGVQVALLVMGLMVLLPQVGINAVLVATLILSSMAQPEVFGLSPTLLALAVMAGWTLANATSPVASTVLIMSQIAGVGPREAGWGWNGGFTLAAAVLLGGWLVVVDLFSF